MFSSTNWLFNILFQYPCLYKGNRQREAVCSTRSIREEFLALQTFRIYTLHSWRKHFYPLSLIHRTFLFGMVHRIIELVLFCGGTLGTETMIMTKGCIRVYCWVELNVYTSSTAYPVTGGGGKGQQAKTQNDGKDP